MFASLLALVADPGLAAPQSATHRVSLDADGHEGAGGSLNPAISDDGRHVAFQSSAPLDPLASHLTDVYVRDRVLGTTTLLSVGAGGVPANSLSSNPSISADGRFVAFESLASNLVAGDGNGARDVFLVDRDPDGNGVYDEAAPRVERVSVGPGGVEANSSSNLPHVSGDGDWVCFFSIADNLVGNDGNQLGDVFCWERASGTVRRVSVDTLGADANGASGPGVLSGDGRWCAFSSAATDLVAVDVNGHRDVFLRDRDPDGNGVFDEGNGLTVLVSVDAQGAQADDDSSEPALSADGSRVAFSSTARNLVAGAGSGVAQVYLRRIGLGTTDLVSVNSSGQPGNGDSTLPSLSDDGAVVAFQSRATDLVAGDTNSWDDVFRMTLASGQVQRVSLTASGAQPLLYSHRVALDADGDEIAFQSPSSDLVAHDANLALDVFVRSAGSWSPQLLVDPLQRGQPGTALLCNALPGEAVWFAHTLQGLGAGPCLTGLGGLCIDLLPPVVNLGMQVTDAMGSAAFTATVPVNAPLGPIWLQVVIRRGAAGVDSVKSNAAATTIAP